MGDVIITFLEMLKEPARAPLPPPRADLTIVHARRPTVAFYRFLYETVGKPWQWTDRTVLDDATLAAIVQDPAVEVHVLYAGGVPAGYFELDRRLYPEVELAYFGLMPEFLGQKLGPYLLDQAIRLAFAYRPTRFWVHTQTLDHPSALPLYQRFGFVPYKTEPL